MNSTTIRNKLLQYIKIADKEHLKALYTLLEDRITEDDVQWFENPSVVKEFTDRYENWKKGKDKGFTISDIEGDIEKLKASKKS